MKLFGKEVRQTSPQDFEGAIPFTQAIPLGLQHVLAMFVGNLTPLMVICGACGLIADEPALYGKIKKYILPEDFTEEIYRRVAERLFRELEEGNFQPAGIISMFEDEEEQREVAALFHTSLPQLDTPQEREKAFHDILLSVKKNSYEYYTGKLGTDVNALKQAVEGRKALEELAKTHISLD